jgi:hypothetical protein
MIYAGFGLQFISYVLLRGKYGLGGWQRYWSLNYAICFMVLVFLYLELWSRLGSRLARGLSCVLTIVILMILFQDAQWQAGRYQIMGERYHRLDSQIGIWIGENTRPSARIGLYQAGAIKFFGDRYIVDFAGLIDRSVPDELRQKGALRLILDKDIDYIAPFGTERLERYGADIRDERFFTRVEIPESRGLVKVRKRAIRQYLQEGN